MRPDRIVMGCDDGQAALKTPVIFDGRNLYDPVLVREMGFADQALVVLRRRAINPMQARPESSMA
jgi:hypothetical protein